MIGGKGCRKAQPDFSGIDPRAGYRPAAGGYGKSGIALPFTAEIPLTDPGAAGDPLIAGLHHLREIVVGDQPAGQRTAGGENLQSHAVCSLS